MECKEVLKFCKMHITVIFIGSVCCNIVLCCVMVKIAFVRE